MIRINIEVEEMRLEVTGHAGYAPPGQDIVCAGVSTLVYTLAQNLAMTLFPENYITQFDEGHAIIEAYPPRDKAEACRCMFMTIANGFAMLEAQFDQYIHLEGD